AGGVQSGPCALVGSEAAHPHDAVAGDRHVGTARLAATSVQHEAAPHDQVVHGVLPSSPSRRAPASRALSTTVVKSRSWAGSAACRSSGWYWTATSQSSPSAHSIAS